VFAVREQRRSAQPKVQSVRRGLSRCRHSRETEKALQLLSNSKANLRRCPIAIGMGSIKRPLREEKGGAGVAQKLLTRSVLGRGSRPSLRANSRRSARPSTASLAPPRSAGTAGGSPTDSVSTACTAGGTVDGPNTTTSSGTACFGAATFWADREHRDSLREKRTPPDLLF